MATNMLAVPSVSLTTPNGRFEITSPSSSELKSPETGNSSPDKDPEQRAETLTSPVQARNQQRPGGCMKRLPNAVKKALKIFTGIHPIQLC